MRRITIVLNKPTEDGETEVHVLSNLPPEIDATVVSDLDLVRWEEEEGFYDVTMTSTCELPTIGSPRAALFLYCMALLAFNVRQRFMAT